MRETTAAAQTSAPPRDDGIYPEIRVIGAIIVLVLIAAFIILYFLPDRTGELFAWKITPTMTPMLMGAGYIGGGWFFTRVVFASRWHHVAWGFLAITTFVWFMLLATVLHLDKFTAGHMSFYAWAFLYIVTPFLVPFLWWRNQRRDPGTPDPGDVVVPPTVRLVTTTAGAVLVLIALFLFLVPDAAINLWPWKLSLLTARVMAGWFALPGIVGLTLGREPRWSGWRVMLQAQMISLVLILIGAARAWNEFDQSRPTTWVFVLGMAGLLLWVAGLYGAMEMRRRRPVAMAAPGSV